MFFAADAAMLRRLRYAIARRCRDAIRYLYAAMLFADADVFA